ncbi:MAG: galactokinase [Actinomycetes bacterium]
MKTLAEQFDFFFAMTPEVIAQAPGRVNLIGEHIDYSDGYVLPFAIKDVTMVAISRREDREIHIRSIQRADELHVADLDELAAVSGEVWVRYPLGVVWAIANLDDQHHLTGLNILIDGKVPLGAGLSSSAALECSIATALNELFELNLSLTELAWLAQKAENDFVGMPCGIMDQSISLMGKSGSALLLDTRNLATENIPFEIASAGLELLIIDTQAHHALVDGGYAQRRASCEKAVSDLGISSLRDISLDDFHAQAPLLDHTTYIRARHAVTEMQRVLDAVVALKSRDFATLGKLINQSHASLRDDYAVSCPELDLAVSTAQSHGALGARMVGGGFGGSAIALIKVESAPKMREAISAAFIKHGFIAPRFFNSLPSDGAKILH